MKFIKVSGESDYGAMEFLDSPLSNDMEALYDEAVSSGGSTTKVITRLEDEEDENSEEVDETVEITALELNIDEDAFITLGDIWADYDIQKSVDIFPVGDWE